MTEQEHARAHATNGAPRHDVGQRMGELGHSAQEFFTQASGAVRELNDYLDLRGRVQRHPYAMLAAAAGVGYVLGGGLFTPLTGRMLRLGLRLAAIPFVKDELISMAEAAVDGFVAGSRGVEGTARPTGATGERDQEDESQ